MTTSRVRSWLCGRLDPGLVRQIDRVARQADVTDVAVMPDVHQGRTVPNGVVVATRRIVYPDLVGADIGCGIAAIRFDAAADEVRRDALPAVLERLPDAVPTLKHPPARAARQRVAVEGLGPLSVPRLATAATRDGAYQLGTLGRGNHFLELARDDEGALWGVVHSGSRAMGQEITAWHLDAIVGRTATADGLPGFAFDEPDGASYFADMEWACRYAVANRTAILNALADLLEGILGIDADAASFIDSPHNTATHERHAGETVIVHRKSANSAAAGQRGLVAGSMAVGSRIVTGLGNTESLSSSAHGAGRIMSRTDAAQRIRTRDLESRMRGIAYHRVWGSRFCDEAPQAYRDLHEVMQAQRDLVRTERELIPILNDKRP